MCAISWVMTEARNSKNERGWRRAGEVLVAQGHAAGVLHRAHVVLRHVELVVLVERVGEVELLLEELEALLGELDEHVGVHVLHQRLAAVVAERDRAELALVDVEHLVVLAGDDRGDVRRHPLGRREAPDGAVPSPGAAGSGVGALETTFQCLGRGHGEGEDGLEVGLLEGGEHAARVGHLELAVEVDPVVGGVDEAVQALAGVGVGAVGAHDERVGRPGGRRAGCGCRRTPSRGPASDR